MIDFLELDSLGLKFMRLAILLLSFYSSLAYSSAYSGSGKVVDILIRRSLDAFSIIYIQGFSSAGSCPKYESKNLVVLSVKNDEHAQAIYSMVLSAYMAEKAIKVVVNDEIKDVNGNCLINDIRLDPGF